MPWNTNKEIICELWSSMVIIINDLADQSTIILCPCSSFWWPWMTLSHYYNYTVRAPGFSLWTKVVKDVPKWQFAFLAMTRFPVCLLCFGRIKCFVSPTHTQLVPLLFFRTNAIKKIQIQYKFTCYDLKCALKVIQDLLPFYALHVWDFRFPIGDGLYNASTFRLNGDYSSANVYCNIDDGHGDNYYND